MTNRRTINTTCNYDERGTKLWTEREREDTAVARLHLTTGQYAQKTREWVEPKILIIEGESEYNWEKDSQNEWEKKARTTLKKIAAHVVGVFFLSKLHE